jgi:Uma2 family endonuclease
MATDVHASEALPAALVDSDAAKFYEFVAGQVLENPAMGAQESILASFLQGLMDPIARLNRLGRVVTETLFLIDAARNLKRRPDLALVSNQRWPLRRRVPRTDAWDVVPDLAVEVIGQTNTADQVLVKIDEYSQAGVQMVWVVYPGSSKVYVYDSPTRVRVLQLGDELEANEVLPGFRVALSTLFEAGGEEVEATS